MFQTKRATGGLHEVVASVFSSSNLHSSRLGSPDSKAETLFLQQKQKLYNILDNADSELIGTRLSRRRPKQASALSKDNASLSPRLEGHKLLYKMNRPAFVNVYKDFRRLQDQFKEQGENHLAEIMTSTKNQARYIREKDRVFQQAKDKLDKTMRETK